MIKHCIVSLSTALLLTLPSLAHAKIVAKSATGFVVEHQIELKSDAKSAYDAFTKIGSWWASSHSFSGEAKNITIDTTPGGCWCEALPNGGFVKHMDVVHAAPGAMLVFSGGLGPLHFTGVAGSMTVRFQAAKNAGITTMTLRYDVGGRDDKNFEEISKAVDGVLAEQIARYKNFATAEKP